MKPILFEHNAGTLDFNSYGLGTLTDCMACEVTEERNGEFELEMLYPVSGIHFSDIRMRRIVYAKPSPSRDKEPFRIYKISKPINGAVTIYAQHISYDLNGIPLSPYSASTAAAAISGIESHETVSSGFTFTTDIVKNAEFSLITPATVRSIFGGREGSLIDVYHGEWKYTKFNCKLCAARGENNGVIIAYGKNLITLEQEENINGQYTGVLPFWYSESDGLVQGNIENVPGTYNFTRILPKDFSDKFEEAPTLQQLSAEATKFIQENDIGDPAVSLKISFVDLSKASGFESLSMLETVELCDTVTVKFEKLGISKTAKVVKTVYDVLKDRYKTVDIGEVKAGIAETIADQIAKMKTVTTRSEMEKAILYATELITGNKGGYVIMNDSDNDGYPDEILIMDKPDKNTAEKVWRWNKNGLGYSSTGYQGPYGLAMTIDGSIVANYITSGTLNANNVNVTNINGENIRDQTIGNRQIGSGAVGYGNTSFKSTLDQVGVNAANIMTVAGTIQAYMQGSLTASYLNANTGNFLNLGFAGRTCNVMGFLDYFGNQRYCIGLS